jgi:hypothetical protein
MQKPLEKLDFSILRKSSKSSNKSSDIQKAKLSIFNQTKTPQKALNFPLNLIKTSTTKNRIKTESANFPTHTKPKQKNSIKKFPFQIQVTTFCINFHQFIK